jgi:hypothetical protein
VSGHTNTSLLLLLSILIIIIKMNLFDNLSDELEWFEVDFSFDDEQDSDLGLDEVAPDDFDVSPPPLPQLAPFAGPSSSKGGPCSSQEEGQFNRSADACFDYV